MPLLELLAALAATKPHAGTKPPPIRPHIHQRGGPVTIGDPIEEDRPLDPRIADHFYKAAIKKGAKPDAAARIARSQALNYLYQLGIFARIPQPYEY